MKISDLLSDIRMWDLVLPEFQREYVWSRDQARQLIVSLVRKYPIGSLLFWKTQTPPELKNIGDLPDKLGTVRVILDGQQRLTSLYLLMENAVPPFYRENDIKSNPRELHYNIETGDLRYYQKILMRADPVWKRVTDCFDSEVEINVFRIAQERAEDDAGAAMKLAQLFSDRLTALRNIKELDLPVQFVPLKATITEAINIFDRVNSQGTKLTDAELALTHVTGKWADARRKLKGKIDQLSKRNFHFDLTFMTRALTVVTAGRALFPTIHTKTREELITGWTRLDKLLDYLVSILPSKAFVHSSGDISSSNLLMPILRFLDLHEGKFPSDESLRRARHWFYAAQMWGRYTSQTDQRLEHDISLIGQEDDSPWSELLEQIRDQRGRINVVAADLEGRWIAHPLFKMTVIVAKSQDAVDWFNGMPIGPATGQPYQLHNHHIFPQALLYSNGYDSENRIHKKLVNEIANRAFITAETNLALGAKQPSDYMPEIEKKFPSALKNQFIPMNSDLWKTEMFREFLEARRKLIAKKINEFMDELVSKPEVATKRTADQLRRMGESATLEFKSTLRWDVVDQQVNKGLQFSVLKTIAAFLNSDGGTLVIGVEDNGDVYGLDRDFKTLKRPTADGFEQTLVNLMATHIGVEFAHFIEIRFEDIESKNVCVMNIDQAGGPAYLKTPKGVIFYVRAGNTSRSLDPQETVAYTETHWQ